MRSLFALAAALVVTLGLLSTDASAGSGDRAGAVQGIVTLRDGTPVPGATVVLHHVRGDYTRRTTTDREGRFGFRRVRPGRYVVGASHDRAGSDRKRIRVHAGEVTRVHLTLHR